MNCRKTLGLVLVWTNWSYLSMACPCEPQHPQSLYCNALFALKVEPMRAEAIGVDNMEDKPNVYLSNEDFSREYTVKVLKVYKGPGINIGSEIQIRSNPNSQCGIRLMMEEDDKKSWFISGSSVDNHYMISSCGFNAVWGELSADQIIGIESAYADGRNCDCLIKKCEKRCRTLENKCQYPSNQQDCYFGSKYCQHHDSPGTGCGWSGSKNCDDER